jgi:hypothetical protein
MATLKSSKKQMRHWKKSSTTTNFTLKRKTTVKPSRTQMNIHPEEEEDDGESIEDADKQIAEEHIAEKKSP